MARYRVHFSNSAPSDCTDGRETTTRVAECLRPRMGRDNASRIAFQMLRVLKERGRKEDVEELDPSQFWPTSIREYLPRENLSQFKKLAEDFLLHPPSVFDEVYLRASETEAVLRDLPVQRLVQTSHDYVITALHAGKNVLASRVIETDVKPLFSDLVPTIRRAKSTNRDDPKFGFRVAPLDALPEIGHKDSERIRKMLQNGMTKEQVCPFKRGISPASEITALRHFWIGLGTIVLIRKLRQIPDIRDNIAFGYGSRIPSARTTFVLPRSDEISPTSEIEKVTFLLLDEPYAIGFDGLGFTSNGMLEEFERNLLQETIPRDGREFGENDFERVLDESMDLERGLLSHSASLENALRSILANPKETNIEQVIKENELSQLVDREQGVSAVKMWTQVAEGDVQDPESIEKFLDMISRKQKALESLLAELRKPSYGIEV